MLVYHTLRNQGDIVVPGSNLTGTKKIEVQLVIMMLLKNMGKVGANHCDWAISQA